MRRRVTSADYRVPVESFSPAVVAPSRGRLVVVVARPRDAAGALVGRGDPAAQAAAVAAQLASALADAGASVDDVMRVRSFVRRMGDWPPMRAELWPAFGEVTPATTLVEVPTLLGEGELLQVEAVAVTA